MKDQSRWWRARGVEGPELLRRAEAHVVRSVVLGRSRARGIKGAQHSVIFLASCEHSSQQINTAVDRRVLGEASGES